MEIETIPRKARLYPPYGVKPDPSLCVDCKEHEEMAGLKYGRCISANMSAYYAQLDGFCIKVAERTKPGADRESKAEKPRVPNQLGGRYKYYGFPYYLLL